MMQSACKTFFCTAILVLLISGSNLYGNIDNIPFIPPVYNYTTNNYKASNQNWAIEQGSNGVIYFGNDKGLLSFDGVNWQLHTLPNNQSVKSIYIEIENGVEKIYVGSFEEFGFFIRDNAGRLIYTSIKTTVEDYEFHNDEIWSIIPFQGKIYFQSFSSIFVYDKNKVEIFNPYPAVLYFFPMGDKLYAQLINSDFCIFNGENFEPVIHRADLNNDDVVAFLHLENDYIMATSKSGLFKFDEERNKTYKWVTGIDSELKEVIVNRAITTNNSQIILGTINNGLYSLNYDGKILWSVNKNNGLNNNTVLALLSDREENIWAALDNGISNVRTQSRYSVYEPTDIQIGLVEDIIIYNNELLLATNHGIYQFSESDKNFKPVPGYNMQSWFIENFGNQLFIGHNLGTLIFHNDTQIPVHEVKTGGTDIEEVTLFGKRFLLESSYTSIYIYFQDNNGVWRYSHRLDGFSDLIKNIETDHSGNIWAGHMYKGVYRLKLSNDLLRVEEIEKFDTLLETDSVLNNRPVRLMKLKGRIVFTDGNYFYTYDDIKQEIVLFEQLNNDLPELADTYRIIPINDELIWFVRNNEYTLIQFDNGYRVIDRIPYKVLNNPPNEGRANVYITEEGLSLFSLSGGIGKYLYNSNEEYEASSLQISYIKNYSRDNDYILLLNHNEKSLINYKNNNIDFTFCYPEFSKKSIKVETFIEGYDNRWVSTDENNSISYKNLPAGDYILKARVTDTSNKQLSTNSYSFKIRNPWYKTWWSYLSYFIVLSLVSYLIIRRHIHKIVSSKNETFIKQENLRLAQLEKQEKQITRLRNEKLETDLIHKGKELASATMIIINHTEFLKNLQSTLKKHIVDGKINRSEGSNLLRTIEKNISDVDEWAVFQENFDLIHKNFFRKLKKTYPSLTPSDLKLCTLLRLNYSTKEIAGLLNISVRGVESARYRLRRKLKLSESDNLVDFLIKFQ